MTVQQIYEAAARLAPPELAEKWDNVGLLVDCGGEVNRVLVALDITPAVVEEAVRENCPLILSHHPVIFSPLKRLTPKDVPSMLLKAGISAVCMHTNLDAAEGGVNEMLAQLFGIRDPAPFAEGCGRIGEIDPVTVPELARRCREILSPRLNQPEQGPAVQLKYTDTGRTVRRLAVISGAGGSLFEEALSLGADCLLTGEANHHAGADGLRMGLSIIAAGHYATEFPIAAVLAQRMGRDCPGVEFLVSKDDRDPYTYI